MTNRQWDLLTGLEPDDMAEILVLGISRQLPEASVLFEIGAEADHLFLVARGRVDLTLPIELDGKREDVLVEERVPGQVLGWSALIPPYRFTLKAIAPLETEIIAFPRDELLGPLSGRPEVGYVVMRNLAGTVGQRLQTLQVMWLRELQRLAEKQSA